MSFSETLKNICFKLNIELSEKQTDLFSIFYEMLMEYNARYNLTAITEEKDVIYKHFADSVSIMMFNDHDEIRKINESSVIDIGTGAGFPGIPLKIINENMSITFLDSVNKKLDFIREVCNRLDFKNTFVVHGRAEDFGRNVEFRENYDLCLSRAVASLPVLSELCIPFVKKGGLFVSYKGSDIDEELNGSKNAIRLLGGKISDIKKFSIPDTDIRRSLIMIKKENNTSEKYPRKVGVPVKKPL